MDRARAATDQVINNLKGRTQQIIVKLGVNPEDLQRLSRIPLIVSIIGLFVNFLLLAAMGNFAWLKATVLSMGQPFTAFLSLTNVEFGSPANPTADSAVFCGGHRRDCSLSSLCAMAPDTSTWDNGSPKSTPVEAWCQAARAGAAAATLLWFGFVPGLAATAFTAMYAAKEIEVVGKLVARVQDLGFTEHLQKIIICSCWAALWLFIFTTMTMYAMMIPDTLGWGVVELEASFGLLRFSFVLVSLATAILTATFFNLWNAENVAEAWMEFQITKLFTFKKALYLELMLQLAFYLFMVIAEIDWSALLIVLAGFYLDAKNRNFLLLYLVLVSISILFDIVKAAGLPSFDNMTPGQSFGATLWLCVFVLKFVIVGTIFAYERHEKESDVGNAWNRFDQVSYDRHHGGYDLGEDEIAE